MPNCENCGRSIGNDGADGARFYSLGLLDAITVTGVVR